MKDYYALGLVLILNLTLFYLLYRRIGILTQAMKEFTGFLTDNNDKISGLRSEFSAQITELQKLSESKGQSTNNWHNAKNVFQRLPWGPRVENE